MNKFALISSTIATLTMLSVSAVSAAAPTPTPTKAPVSKGGVTPTPTKTQPTATPTATPVAKTPCESSYGGYGQKTCDRVDFIIDKKVADPKTVGIKGQNPSNFQDNFGINANKYVPGQIVPFQITVKNTGTKTLNDVKVVDKLPANVTLISPKDNYNTSTREVTITIGTLQPNETRVMELTVQIDGADALPNQSVICLTNEATMHAAGQTDKNAAEFCVQKENVGGETKGGLKVFPPQQVTKSPSTGPELLALAALIPGGIGGLLLRKKALNK